MSFSAAWKAAFALIGFTGGINRPSPSVLSISAAWEAPIWRNSGNRTRHFAQGFALPFAEVSRTH